MKNYNEILFVSIGGQQERKNKESIMSSFIDIEKSHVKGFARTTKLGKTSQVKDYENRKIKKLTLKEVKEMVEKLPEGKTKNKFKENLKILEKRKEEKSQELKAKKELDRRDKNEKSVIQRNKEHSDKIVEKMPDAIRNVFDIHKTVDNDFETRDFIDIFK